MTTASNLRLAASVALAALGLPVAIAQQTPLDAPVALEGETAAPALQGETGAPAINEDEMADFLNAQQQVKQNVTLTRTVDGQVVETRKETIIYSKDDPVRSTEAAPSALERLKADFDKASLTRSEAYDEAKLDFVIADQDRNDVLTADEFAFLVETWRKSDAVVGPAEKKIARERFVEFLGDSDAAALDSEAQAHAKFAAMAGADIVLGRKKYMRAVLADFSINDLDGDGALRGEELLNYRAANRGESLGPARPPELSQ